MSGWRSTSPGRARGADPAEELARHADRIFGDPAEGHRAARHDAEDGWTAMGDGIVDWQTLWPLFSKTKADQIVVEHDNPADWRKFAQRSYDFLKRLGA